MEDTLELGEDEEELEEEAEGEVDKVLFELTDGAYCPAPLLPPHSSLG